MNHIILNEQSMALELRTERTLLILSVIMLALAFPFQVIFNSPMPALFPYAVLAMAFANRIHSLYRRSKNYEWFVKFKLNNVDKVIVAYGVLIGAHAVINLFVGDVDLIKIGNILVNYFFPLAFYIYFRIFFTKDNIRSIVIGVLVGSSLVIIYSIPHAYLKMHNAMLPGSDVGNVNNNDRLNKRDITLYEVMESYQVAAGEYSRMRVDGGSNFLNSTMRSGGTRSAGLLESHSVTAAWIAMGMFGAIAIIRIRQYWVQFTIVLTYMIMLFIFHYYTAIIAAIISITFIGINKKYSKKHTKLIMLILVTATMAYLIIDKYGWADKYLKIAGNIAKIKLNMIFGNSEASYIDLVCGKINNYVNYVTNDPLIIIFGDGFGIYYTYSYPKGSDIGFVETMARLGIPMLFIILIAMVTWMYRYIKRNTIFYRHKELPQTEIPVFTIGILIYVVTNDLHYSIWPAKSILPILMVILSEIGLSRSHSI